jgi:Zn finger protein HypA/HybF involved in hydrogenase expression
MDNFERVRYTPPVPAQAICPKCGHMQANNFPDAKAYMECLYGTVVAMDEVCGTVICPQCKTRLIP